MRETTLLAEPPGSASHHWSPSRVLKKLPALCLGLAAALVVVAVLGPMLLPYRTYVVRSGSMRPTIPVGALGVYRPVSAGNLGPGDVIAFARPGSEGEIVTHRIVAVEEEHGERTFVTKGDANGEPDGWRVPATGSGWRYRFGVPGAGYALVALGSPQGRQLMLVAVVAGAAGLMLVRIWRPQRRRTAPPVTGDDAPPEAAPVVAADATRLTLADSVSVILGHTDLLLRTMAPDDQGRPDAEAIRRAAERAAAVFGDQRWGPDPVTARSGTRPPEPSAGTGCRPQPLAASGGRDADAR